MRKGSPRPMQERVWGGWRLSEGSEQGSFYRTTAFFGDSEQGSFFRTTAFCVFFWVPSLGFPKLGPKEVQQKLTQDYRRWTFRRLGRVDKQIKPAAQKKKKNNNILFNIEIWGAGLTVIDNH